MIALIGLGNQFVDLARRDLPQNAVTFSDRKQDGVEHLIHAAHDAGIGPGELFGLAPLAGWPSLEATVRRAISFCKP